MTIVLTIFHVLFAFLLMIVVLIQAGKGSDIGAAFGGGASNTMFGPRGATTVLHKITAGLAAGFMFTSLVLAILGGRSVSRSIIPDEPMKPATQSAPAGAPAAPAKTGESTAPAVPAAPAAPAAPTEPTKR
jgi:preprotein translocase subunit SecG